MSAKPAATERVPARERLLAAAEELFYEEGVNTVGIERVIERAGVAKASLYNTFGSKEELIRAYLLARHDERTERVTRQLAQHASARDKILAVFDGMRESFERPGFRGCAFVRASAELKADSSLKQVFDDSRAWTRNLFTQLAREAGARNPAALAQQLELVYDGALVSAQMDCQGDHKSCAAVAARDAAAIMVAAATGKHA